MIGQLPRLRLCRQWPSRTISRFGREERREIDFGADIIATTCTRAGWAISCAPPIVGHIERGRGAVVEDADTAIRDEAVIRCGKGLSVSSVDATAGWSLIVEENGIGEIKDWNARKNSDCATIAGRYIAFKTAVADIDLITAAVDI